MVSQMTRKEQRFKEEGVNNRSDVAVRSRKKRTQMCPLELAKLLEASERGFSGVVGTQARLQRLKSSRHEKQGDRQGRPLVPKAFE